MRSNCYVWAFFAYRNRKAQWRLEGRQIGKEPALRFRDSRLKPGPLFHAQVEFWDGQQWAIEQFVPDDPNPLPWWQFYRAIWFRGHVKRGDSPQEQ